MPFELDAADDALGERQLLAGNIGPDGREHALHAGACVRRAADDLDRTLAGVYDANLQPVGVGMLLGFNDRGDDEAVILAARVLDQLNLEADAGQGVDDLGERSRGVEMVEQPGEGEFHRRSVCAGSFRGFCLATLRSGFLRTGRLGAAEHARDADVLADFGPMDSERR